MTKKFFKIALCVCLSFCVLFGFTGCSNKNDNDNNNNDNDVTVIKEIKFDYETFNSYLVETNISNGILKSQWYNFEVTFTITNNTDYNTIIYENNFRASIDIDGELLDYSLSFLYLGNGYINESSIDLYPGQQVTLQAKINARINMLNNASRKINIFYNEDLKFYFVPTI